MENTIAESEVPPGLSSLFLFALQAPPGEVYFIIILIGLLLICSALISASEVAYFSLTPHAINELKRESSRTAHLIVQLLDKPRRLLATILIANNMVNIAVVILTYMVTLAIIDVGDNLVLDLVLNGIIATALILLVGEVLPKVYAAQRSIQVARFMSAPMNLLTKLFSPFSFLLVNTAKFIEKSIQPSQSASVTMEEMNHAIDITVGKKTSSREVNILKSIVKFGNINAKQIMRPRLDMVAIEDSADFDAVMMIINESGYSRIPVYHDDFDTIAGILFAKDLLPFIDRDKNFDWKTLIRAPFFVPESKKIDDLLKEFQTNRMHMAIVVDEYGGTTGLVTLEDVLEEVIGEIKDEFDEETELHYQKIDDNTFVFEGKTLIGDICRVMGLSSSVFDEVKGESDSLAGLVLEISGKFPVQGDQVEYKNFQFIVLSVGENRLRRIKMKQLLKKEENSES